MRETQLGTAEKKKGKEKGERKGKRVRRGRKEERENSMHNYRGA